MKALIALILLAACSQSNPWIDECVSLGHSQAKCESAYVTGARNPQSVQ